MSNRYFNALMGKCVFSGIMSVRRLRSAAVQRRSRRLRLEELEPRWVPDATQVVFTTPSQALLEGQPSAVMTIQLEDAGGQPATSGSDLTFNLSTTAGTTGQFLDANGFLLLGNTVTIPAGSSTAQFEYADSHWGFPVLAATSTSLSASQQETVNPSATQSIFTPAQIRIGYGLNQLSLDGTGQTVAVLGAFDDPNIVQDIDTFDQDFGLTSAGPTLYNQYGAASSFLTVYNQDGQTSPLPNPPTGSFAQETSLDVEWVHAIAPGAKIDLVEADDNSNSNLEIATVTAAGLPGVSVFTTSYGSSQELSTDAANDSDYVRPGVTFFDASGDDGTTETGSPAFVPTMVQVGGTNLSLNPDGTYQGETGWSGAGGGVSQFEPEPLFQLGVQSTGNRVAPDVAFDAGPNTGVDVVDSFDNPTDPLGYAYGTSFAAPAWAGITALVNQGRAANGLDALDTLGGTETLEALYSLPASDFHSNLGGDNGTNTHGLLDPANYDEITGLGSPLGNLLVPDLISYGSAIHFNQTSLPAGVADAAYDQPIVAAGGNELAYTVTSGAIPTGLTLATSNNELLVSGTPTDPGTVAFEVTTTDDLSASVTQDYTLTILSNAPPQTVVFTTDAQTLTAGTAGTFTVGLLDGNGLAAAAGSGGVTLTLSSSDTTGTFLDAKGIPLTGNTITIAQGAPGISFEYKDTKAGTPTLTVSDTGLTSAMQQESIIAGAPSAVKFTSAAQTLTVGTASGSITVALSDRFNNPTTAVGGGLTLTLSSSSTGGTFLDTADNPLTGSTITVAAGSSTASFEYKDTLVGTPTLTVSASGLSTDTQQETVNAAPDMLVFTSTVQTLTAGQDSSTITVQLQKPDGTPDTAGSGGITVVLSSSSSAGSFLDTGGHALSGDSVTIASGTSMVSFEYEDTVAGSPLLTATATGLTLGTQHEIVNAGPASALVFTTPSQETQTDEPSGTISVERTDRYGNAVPVTGGGLTLTLSTTSPAGTFLDSNGNPLAGAKLTIAAGSSSAGFEYSDSDGGNPTLKAVGGGLTATQQESIDGAITVSPNTLPYGTVNQFYGQSIFAFGGDENITLSVSNQSGSIAGLSISTIPGSSSVGISGMPTATGTTTFTVTARDTSGDVTIENYSVTITTLSLTPTFLPDATVNIAYSQTITAGGGTGTTTLTVSNIANPIPGLTIPSSGTGSLTISGMPTAGGDVTFTVTAQDSAGNLFIADYNLNVDVIGFTPTALPSASVGVPYSQTISPIGGVGSVTLQVSNQFGSITGLSITGAGTGSLTIIGKPSAAGSLSFEVDATDSDGNTTSTDYSVNATVPTPTSIAFTTPAQTVTAGQVSGTITVQLQDENNNPVVAGPGGEKLTLILPAESSVTLLDVNGNSLSSLNFTIPQGSSTFSFKFKDTVAGSLFLQVTGGLYAEQTETVQGAAASTAVIVSGTPALLAGQSSGDIQVQLQDAFGNPAPAGSGGVSVVLSSTSVTGEFLDLSGTALPSSSLTIEPGETTADFEYEDSTAGTPTLKVTPAGFAVSQTRLTVAALSSALQVTNTNDAGPGSLRQAILAADAAPGSSIIFDPGVAGTIDLLTALPELTTSMAVVGPGANLLTIERSALAKSALNFFTVAADATVTLSGLSLANGDDTAVFNDEGTLTLDHMVIENNHSTNQLHLGLFGSPGGVLNLGTLSVLNSTIADNTTANSAVAAGIDSEGGSVTVFNSTISGNVDQDSNSSGGIGIYDGGTLFIANSTVTGNVAQISNIYNTSGGGIDAQGSSAIIFDTIVAGNTGSAGNASDVSGSFTSLGHNLIGIANSLSSGFTSSDLVGTAASPIDAKLGPLGDHGGPTPTQALLTGSAAIDAGDSTGAPGTDQRGMARIINGVIDIGAFESNSATTFAFTTSPQKLTAGQLSGTITVELLDADGNPLLGGSGGTAVSLSSSSATGIFLDSNGNTISTVMIAADASSASFEYEDTLVGTPKLTVSAAGVVSAQQPESIAAAPADHLTIAAPTSVVPGGAFSVTLHAFDHYGNTDLNYTGPASLALIPPSASGKLSGSLLGQFASGTATLTGLSLSTIGNYTLFAAGSGAALSATASVNVTTVTHFSVALMGSVPVGGLPAGDSLTFLVTALDKSGNTVSGYTGTIHFTSSTGQAGLSSNYTFTTGSGDNGSHSFTIPLDIAGKQTISVADTLQSKNSGTSSPVLVIAGAPDHLRISGFPTTDVAETAHNVTVQAVDAFNNVVLTDTDTVQLSSGTDNAATGLPASSALTSGSHTFTGVVLNTVGSQSLTAQDTSEGLTSTPYSVQVQSAATALSVVGPKTATAGQSFNVTVKALAGSAIDTQFPDTISFSTTDRESPTGGVGTSVFLASDHGSKQFTITLYTAGTQTITITDISRGSVKKAVLTVGVSHGAVERFNVSYPTQDVVGAAHSLTVKAVDEYGNIVPTYSGTVTLSGSGAKTKGLPASYKFTSADGGSHTFPGIVLNTVSGSTTPTFLSVSEKSNPDLSGSAYVFVQSAATALSVSGPKTAAAGTPVSINVKALAGSTVDTQFSDTISFSTSDKQAQSGLPAAGPLTSGSGKFTITLYTAGTQTITVTDTTRGSVTKAVMTVQVIAGAVSQFQVSNNPGTTPVGASDSFTVSAEDQYGNIVPTYTGTVQLSTTDSTATGLLASYPFKSVDAGKHAFSLAFGSAGTWSLKASDSSTPSIAGSASVNALALTPSITPSSATTVRGQTVSFTLAVGVPSLPSGTALAWQIDWNGDGIVDQTVTGAAGATTITVPHVFPTALSDNVKVTVGIASGNTAPQSATATVQVVPMALETEAGGATDLVIGGTTGKETILITPAGDASGETVSVSINGMVQSIGNQTTFSPTGHIEVYGQGGGDTIRVQSATIGGQSVSVAIPAVLFSGGGNSTLSVAGSSATTANVLVGGAGNDLLTGGSGADILIGGAGKDTMQAGSGSDILINGNTAYDANLAALLALSAEWGSGMSFATRVQDLFNGGAGALNGNTLLNAQAVIPDPASISNQLFGSSPGLDWFWLLAGTDKLSGETAGELETLD